MKNARVQSCPIRRLGDKLSSTAQHSSKTVAASQTWPSPCGVVGGGDSLADSFDGHDGDDLVRKFKLFVNVGDRRYRLVNYRRCFAGCEAVDALVESEVAATREDGVRIGRYLAVRYGLFERAGGGGERVPFKDDYVLYRFKDDPDAAAPKKKNEPSSVVARDGGGGSLRDSESVGRRCAWERAMAVVDAMKSVEVKDRKYHLKTYRDCFVGRELVDVLLSAGCGESREEAVLVGTMVNNRFDLFEHVADEHDFEDAYLFYRFKDKSSLFCGQSDDSTAATGSMTSLSEDLRSSLTNANGGGVPTGSIETSEEEGAKDYSFSSLSLSKKKDIEELWGQIFRRVEVKDRCWHLKSYKNCFVASELVDLLVSKALAKSRADAVRLARIVNSQSDLFEHVQGQRDFEDEYLFFRFKN